MLSKYSIGNSVSDEKFSEIKIVGTCWGKIVEGWDCLRFPKTILWLYWPHKCIDLTKEYGLHISEGKKHTNVNKFRGAERIRYVIFNIVNEACGDESISSLDKLETRLNASGVGIEYKFRHGTNEIQGLWYIREGKRFPASKIDRRFSLGNICKHISKNRLRHPDSKWMYADGSIVPIHSYQGLKLSARQVEDYTACKSHTGWWLPRGTVNDIYKVQFHP